MGSNPSRLARFILKFSRVPLWAPGFLLVGFNAFRRRLGEGALPCFALVRDGVVSVVVAGLLSTWAAQSDEQPASAWEKLVSVRTMAGYKDNVLLSAQDPDASGFVGLLLEAIVWRPIGASGEIQAFLVGEHRQFLSATDLEREQTVVAQVAYEHHLSYQWTVKAPVEVLYVDQILDVSATEDVKQAARVLGHTLALRPAVQRHWVPGTLELELSGLRQLYQAPLDPSWELGTELKWQQSFASHSQGEIAYGFGQTWHDDEPERTAGGEPVPGSRRTIQRHDLLLELRQDWGNAGDWRLTIQASGRYATDLASGYYDFVRPAVGVRLRYRRAGWLAEGRIRFRHYRYLTQKASDSVGNLRRRTEMAAELRVERVLLPWLRVFAEYQYEETFANRPLEEYSANTVSGGFEASF